MKKLAFFAAIGLSCIVASALLVGCGETVASNSAIAAKALPVASNGWQLVSSSSEKFAVLMPGAATQGNVSNDTQKFTFQGSGFGFAVLSTDWAKVGTSNGQLQIANSNDVLENVIAGFVSEAKGQVLSKKDMRFQGQPGKEVVISMPVQSAQTKMRVIFANNHSYQVFVAAPASSFPTQSADYFLDSFTLLP